MSVTTLLHPRSPFHPNASDESEMIRPEDGFSKVMPENADDDDLMSGFLVGWFSREEGEENEWVWKRAWVLMLPRKESNREESGNPDADDEFEGT